MQPRLQDQDPGGFWLSTLCELTKASVSPWRPMTGSLVGILYIPFMAVCGWWETVSDSKRG